MTIIREPYFAADIVVIKVYLQAGERNALEIRLFGEFFIRKAALFHAHAFKIARGFLAEIGSKSVRTEIPLDFSARYYFFIGERNAVRIERRGIFAALHRAFHFERDFVAVAVLQIVADFMEIIMRINRLVS